MTAFYICHILTKLQQVIFLPVVKLPASCEISKNNINDLMIILKLSWVMKNITRQNMTDIIIKCKAANLVKKS